MIVRSKESLRFQQASFICSREHNRAWKWPIACHGGNALHWSTAVRPRPKVYRQVIALLTQGTSDAKIAKLYGVSRNTVAAVRQVEAQTIEQRKQTIPATATRVAELGFERIEGELAAGNIKGA